ncbi:MAG TPA: regulatory protein RecX [Propionibacteriaceae bacterium]|nr:regulatory protein RecX [Propionibacteriaceae bacterium]
MPIDARAWLERHGEARPDQRINQSVSPPPEPTEVGSALPPSDHVEDGSTAFDDHADAESIARSIALRKLTARARTRHELDQALRARNVPPSVREAVLERIQDLGLVDDASFAVDWVTSRQQRRHLSRRALRRELEAKGVERNDINTALEEVDFNSELATARDLIARKRPQLSGLTRDVQYRRLAGILSRRGFDSALTVQVLNESLDAQSDERHM